MKRSLDALSRKSFDLVVIGGGMFGACAAWDAACRGLSVALLERTDFASGASWNHFKVIHGGIRYLQHPDFARVRESVQERNAFLRMAPHLSGPLPILMPSYGHGLRGKGLLRIGFGLYDVLSVDRNRGISDPSRRLPRSRYISRDRALQMFPGLPSARLTGGAIFADGQMYSAPRLVVSIVRAAAELGAQVANYLEVEAFLRQESRVVGVRARDRRDGGIVDVRGRVVLNAAGPSAHRLLKRALGLELGSRTPTFSRDVAMVTRRRPSCAVGLACPTTSRDEEAVLDRGGRHLFFLPWREHTLVGVWHGVEDARPEELTVEPEEVRAYIHEANDAFPGLGLREEDVALVHAGLVLFGRDDQTEGSHRFGHRSLLIDHGAEDGLAGLVTLVGVRATTARRMGEEALDLVVRLLGGRTDGGAPTRRARVWGGDFEGFESLVDRVREAVPGAPRELATALAHRHGSRFTEVLEAAPEDTGPEVLEGSEVLAAEVTHAVRSEMALTLRDIVLRRTDLGTAGHPGRPALARAAELAAAALGWDDAEREREIEDAETFFAHRGALSRPLGGGAAHPRRPSSAPLGTTSGAGGTAHRAPRSRGA